MVLSMLGDDNLLSVYFFLTPYRAENMVNDPTHIKKLFQYELERIKLAPNEKKT